MALETLDAIANHFSNGWFDKYPPVHYAILAVFYTPYIGYLLLSGGLQAPNKVFPYGFADPLSALTHFILIARVVSALMGVVIVLLVYLTGRELFDRRSAFFAALIVALCHPLVYHAHNANVDVPYLFWALLAIVNFLLVLKQGRLKHYMLFALFATLAICTKDQAYGLFLLSPLPILWIRFTETSGDSRQRPSLADVIFDRRLLSTAIVAMATFILAHNLIFNFSGFLNHVQWLIGEGSQPYASYAPTLLGRLQLLWETGAQLALGFTPPLFGLCLVGSFYCASRFPRYSLPLLFLAASYHLLFINVISYSYLRFVLPIGIILTFFGGKLLADIWSKGKWKALTRAAICLVFTYAVLFPLQLDFLFIRESRHDAEQWMREHAREGALVETFQEPPGLYWWSPRFPSWVRIRSSKLEAGTQWELYTRGFQQVHLPNLYFGKEDPDYIVLSLVYKNQFLENEARVLDDLFDGCMGYTLLATFKTPTFVPIHSLPINPRIDIFAKTKKLSMDSESSRASACQVHPGG